MERTRLEQKYQTKARETWANFLRYDETDQTYKFYVEFMYGNWGEPNRIALVFDKQGEYVGTKSFIWYKFKKTTMEETEQDHKLYALNFKEKAEKLIKRLIEPVEKEKIVFHLENTWSGETGLYIDFDLGKLSYRYEIHLENPYRNRFVTVVKEGPVSYYIQIHEIPSLKEIKPFIRSHPKIRVKYVNELAHYEQVKQKLEKEHKRNLDNH